MSQKTYITFSIIFAVLVFVSLFAELFFDVPLDFGGNHVASIICINIIKVLLTLAFTFFTLMGTLWSKSEKSAVLTGKFSMMTILKRLKKLWCKQCVAVIFLSNKKLSVQKGRTKTLHLFSELFSNNFHCHRERSGLYIGIVGFLSFRP